MEALGSPQNPLKVAIVGSGPSGFYAAEALFSSNCAVEVSVIERLPVPYGLVRSGVAPDHPKLKQPILVYEKIAQTAGFNFFGNVQVGRDITVPQLLDIFHAVIFACGAESDKQLCVPGEKLTGVHAATEFVGWYNGHPDYRHRSFDLSQETVAIVGQGNVAIDVARILAKTVDELRFSDIAEHAFDALAVSKVKEIHLIGRRGPAQAKFTPQELQELGSLADCDPYVDPNDLIITPEDEVEIADKMNRNSTKNMQIFARFANTPKRSTGRRCYFHFLRSPQEVLGTTRVKGLRLVRNRLRGAPFSQIAEPTDVTEDLPCGLIFRSVGYKGIAMEGVPFDDKRGTFPHREGRLIGASGEDLCGLYVTGWIKRGPSGVIGTNRADSVGTVATLLSDLPVLGKTRPGAACLAEHLRRMDKRFVTYVDWTKIDHVEIQRGMPTGKPREKFTSVTEMLAVIAERTG